MIFAGLVGLNAFMTIRPIHPNVCVISNYCFSLILLIRSYFCVATFTGGMTKFHIPCSCISC